MMLRRLYSVAVRVTKLAGLLARKRFRAMAYYAKLQRREPPIAHKTVLFESYRAVKMADSPYAMFLAMLDDPHYADFTFVWALNDAENEYRRALVDRTNVRFCTIHSREYVRALASAKYLVNNKAWPFYFAKRDGQVSVNTWHATAFKALGKEQGGSIGQFKNTTRNLLHTDYLVMPNRFTSEVMLRSNDVAGVFPGVVIEEGYPRIDLTVNTTPEAASALLRRVSGASQGKKVALYAPTWRGETGSYGDTAGVVVAHVRELRERLSDDYELVLKVHDLTYTHLRSRKDLSGIRYVPDWVDANEILPGVDVVITDYSSIFFDFLVLDRPVIFFAYDLEDYAADRGLYFDMAQMPGPLCRTASEVAQSIDRLGEIDSEYAPRRAAMCDEYCASEDGGSSKRVCDVIFKGVESPSAYRSFDADKTRILAAGCDFDHTSATFEVIGLSKCLDYATHDLTVLFTAEMTPERQRLITMLDPRARVLYSHSYPTLTFREIWDWEARKAHSAGRKCGSTHVERWGPYVRSELNRLLGATHYHAAVCFTDQLNEGTYLVAFGEFERRLLWLANPEQDSDKALPTKVLLKRFDRVFAMPGVEQSRCVRQLVGRIEKKGAEPDEFIRPIGRFVGFDASVTEMLAEHRQQVKRRVSVAVHRLGDDGCVNNEHEVRMSLMQVFTEGLERVANQVRALTVSVEAQRGFDHLTHNQRVLKTFTHEVAATKTRDTSATSA